MSRCRVRANYTKGQHFSRLSNYWIFLAVASACQCHYSNKSCARFSHAPLCIHDCCGFIYRHSFTGYVFHIIIISSPVRLELLPLRVGKPIQDEPVKDYLSRWANLRLYVTIFLLTYSNCVNDVTISLWNHTRSSHRSKQWLVEGLVEFVLKDL